MADHTPGSRDLTERLVRAGQEHLARHLASLAPDARARLETQFCAIDLEGLPRLIDRYVRRPERDTSEQALEPAPSYPARPDSNSRQWDRAETRRHGESLIRAGRIGAFTVAGGQGSRLGFEGPKGCYPAGAVTGKPLFQCLADWILAAEQRYLAGSGRVIPWYIMTSPLNHGPTIAFFDEHRHFGLRPDQVMFFPQGVMPSLELGTGRLMLAGPDELAVNPDGHGGSLRALRASGALDDMRRRGIEHLSYTQIDNPLVRVVDPVFIGLHAGAPDSSGEMSSKMIPKASPGEKLGVFGRSGGTLRVIEYSDLPPRLAEERLPDGRLRYDAGSIAIHVLSRSFIERLTEPGSPALPFHRAVKKVPWFDPATGRRVEPREPNAVKLEAFVFDAIPLCRASIVMETVREDEFAPIKNAEGPDSPATCSAIQTARAARWLEHAGVPVPRDTDGRPDCTLELSPRTAMWPEDLAGRPGLPCIERGTRLSL